MRHSSAEGRLRTYCVIVIMQSEWWIVLMTKSNLYNMVELNMYLLKELY